MISKSNNRKIGILLQYSQMGLSIIISFVYTPVMLKILGSSEYGLYNLANSIISYLSLLSLGFGASYIRFYSKYKANKDEEGIAKLNGLYLIVFIIIGIIALICGVLLSGNIANILNDTYTKADKQIAGTLMIIMAINLAWSFPSSVFTAYITSQEKFIFQKSINMIRTVIGPFVTLPVLLLGYGSIGMVVISTIVTFFADVINIIYCKRIGMNILFKNIDFLLLKDIFVFSIFIAINQIIDQINWATDKVILGKVCNGAVVAYYSIGAQINTYFTQFSTAVSSVFVPEIHRIESSELTTDEINKKQTDLFIKVGRLQFILLALILTGFILFGKFFVSVWAGVEYSSSYYVAILLMTPEIVPLTQNIGIEVQRAKNKHQFRSVVYLVMAIINIIISIYFAALWGEIGAAIGTTISLVLANGLVMNIFYHKVIGINILLFWKKIMILMPGIIIPCLIMKCMVNFWPTNSITRLLVGIAFYVILYALCIFVIGLDANEKKYIISKLRKVIGR